MNPMNESTPEPHGCSHATSVQNIQPESGTELKSGAAVYQLHDVSCDTRDKEFKNDFTKLFITFTFNLI